MPNKTKPGYVTKALREALEAWTLYESMVDNGADSISLRRARTSALEFEKQYDKIYNDWQLEMGKPINIRELNHQIVI